MNSMYDFFTTQSSASTMLYLCLTAFTGTILGKLEIKGIKLGIAGVLFSGILIAHFRVPIDAHILYFIRDFGLVLFVYSIGLSMGPRFFSSFKKDGLLLNILAIGVVLGGFGIACLIYCFTNLSSSVIVGTLCGAATNTPSLGAAQQVLAEQGAGDAIISETGMAYAIAYPFGILGIIVTILLIRLFFKINISSEVRNYAETSDSNEMNLQSVEITVSNPNLFGKSIDYVKHITDKELAISRIVRNGKSIIAIDAEILQEGDVICGVSSQNLINSLEIKIGRSEIVKNKEDIPGPLSIINVLLTSQKLAGKTIEQIGIYRRYPANITRIYRSGIKILPTLKTTLELGDTIRIVGKKRNLE